MACLARTGHVCPNWTWTRIETRIGLGIRLDLDILDDLLCILAGLLAGPLHNS